MRYCSITKNTVVAAIFLSSAWLSFAQELDRKASDNLTSRPSTIVLNKNSPPISANVDFQEWNQILSKYRQNDGRIKYKSLCEQFDDRKILTEILAKIATQDEALLSTPSSSLSFWMNTYNIAAMEVKLRQIEDPDSVPETTWKNVHVHVGHQRYSLDDIEQTKLRPIGNPFIHFGLHCGATSCPKIAATAWTSDTLDSSLREATKDFLSQPNAVRWEASKQTLHLSKIFDWYRSDFGQTDEDLLAFVLPFLNSEVRNEIEVIGTWNCKVSFLEYDWSLYEDIETLEPSTSYSSELPVEVDFWIDQAESFELGLTEADQLRRKLLEPFDKSSSLDRRYTCRADLVAIVIKSFQQQMESDRHLKESVGSFHVSSDSFQAQLKGEVSLGDPSKIFSVFDGRWFGLWDVHPVNHDWRPTRVYSPSPKTSNSGLQVVADQYAWIHNGFGWNYLVKGDESTHPYVLGQVYYLNDQNLSEIAARKPHVGVVDRPADENSQACRLIWITEQEIFLEEGFPNVDESQSYYVITGIYHSLFEKHPSISDQAVQAKYTRQSNPRPAFQKIVWKPIIFESVDE
jgi:hypothetical protein